MKKSNSWTLQAVSKYAQNSRVSKYLVVRARDYEIINQGIWFDETRLRNCVFLNKSNEHICATENSKQIDTKSKYVWCKLVSREKILGPLIYEEKICSFITYSSNKSFKRSWFKTIIAVLITTSTQLQTSYGFSSWRVWWKVNW